LREPLFVIFLERTIADRLDGTIIGSMVALNMMLFRALPMPRRVPGGVTARPGAGKSGIRTVPVRPPSA
jgi:hypothetical protein